MRRLGFYAKSNRSNNLLHIETDGAVINIRVGLRDDQGRAMTRVDVLPDNEYRGGDGYGNFWSFVPGDGPGVVRVLRYRDQERPDGQLPAAEEADPS